MTINFKEKVNNKKAMFSCENREELFLNLDRTITATLHYCLKGGEWNEDQITCRILGQLRDDFAKCSIAHDEYKNSPSCFTLDAYKNRAKDKVEFKFGDIGILIRIHFDNDKSIEGVALLEAKRIYTSEFGQDHVTYPHFKELKINQLKRCIKNSVNHRTIFYDFYSTAKGVKFQAKTIPSQHLVELNNKKREVTQYAEDFSFSLAHRYMQGSELNYSSEIIDAFKGNSPDTEAIGNLVVIDYYPNSNKLLGKNTSKDINMNVYEEIEKNGFNTNDWYPNKQQPLNRKLAANE